MSRKFSVLLSGSLFSARDYANLDHRGILSYRLVFAIRFKNTRSAIKKEWSFSFRLNESGFSVFIDFLFGR